MRFILTAEEEERFSLKRSKSSLLFWTLIGLLFNVAVTYLNSDFNLWIRGADFGEFTLTAVNFLKIPFELISIPVAGAIFITNPYVKTGWIAITLLISLLIGTVFKWLYRRLFHKEKKSNRGLFEE